ncbi:MAG: acetyl-CoA carboxylase carboxyl transferase subunit beta, partial [Pseudomonadota bacterium]
MNWLTNFRTPGLKGLLSGTKKDTPENLWVKCPESGELVYRSDLEESWYVTPAGAHLRISPRRRFRLFFDDERWEAIPLPSVPADPLKFKDDKA